MGLIKRNGIYYIKMLHQGQLVKFSLKTRNSQLAEQLLFAFHREMIKDHFPVKVHLSNAALPVVEETQLDKKEEPIKPHFESYLEICKMKNYVKSTMFMKQKLLEILSDFKIKNYKDFNQDKINILLTYLQNKYHNDSVKKFISETKAFLNFSIKQGLFERSSYERLCFPSIETKCRDTIISKEDFCKIDKDLADKGDQDFAMYLNFLRYTGCRPGEAVNVKISDIDMEKHSVKVFQNKTKKYAIHILPNVFVGKLNDYLQEAKITEFLFKGKQQGLEFYSKKFKKLKVRLNLNLQYNLYTYRHTFATNLINATGDLHLVSASLGHSDVKITSKYYINRNSEDIRAKINECFKENKAGS